MLPMMVRKMIPVKEKTLQHFANVRGAHIPIRYDVSREDLEREFRLAHTLIRECNTKVRLFTFFIFIQKR